MPTVIPVLACVLIAMGYLALAVHYMHEATTIDAAASRSHAESVEPSLSRTSPPPYPSSPAEDVQ
jgi:hypothetical protein